MKVWSAEIKELETLYTSIKGRFPELEKELEKLVKADDENMVLIYARRCLEVIVTDLCECELNRPRKTEPLKGVIDKLNKEEKVPSHIITSMQNLNSLSTYGAHPKEFDPRQVKSVLNNLTTIIEWYLRYKASDSKSKVEQEKYESKGPDDSTEDTGKPKKRLLLMVSGFLLVCVIVIVTLLVFNVIVGRKQDKAITELEKSIAVLPFINWNSEEEYAHMGDAIANEINTQLAKIKEFHVFSYTSSSQYKGSDKPSTPQIGKELGANFIIEGTIERQDENVSIHVQVILTENDDHIWAHEFKGKWKDIFTVRAEIAVRIAEELKIVLSPKEIEQIEKKPTENLEAYNLYLLGRFYWNKRTEEDLKKSIEYFEHAIEINPNYTLASAGLADAYMLLATWGYLPQQEAYMKAKEIVLEVLEIDNNLAEAHASLGLIACFFEYNWQDAEKEFKRAIELNPNYTQARSWYALFLGYTGQFEEAFVQINKALEMDPLSLIANYFNGNIYIFARQYDEAIIKHQKVLEIDKNFIPSHEDIFSSYLHQGMDIEAIEKLQEIMSMDTLTVKYVKVVGDIYEKSGIKGVLHLLIDLELTGAAPDPYALAEYYAMLGEKEQALGWLDRLYELKAAGLASLKVNPAFDNLRTDPRFIELVKKMGFEN